MTLNRMSSEEPHGYDILLPPDGSISKLQESLLTEKFFWSWMPSPKIDSCAFAS